VNHKFNRCRRKYSWPNFGYIGYRRVWSKSLRVVHLGICSFSPRTVVDLKMFRRFHPSQESATFLYYHSQSSPFSSNSLTLIGTRKQFTQVQSDRVICFEVEEDLQVKVYCDSCLNYPLYKPVREVVHRHGKHWFINFIWTTIIKWMRNMNGMSVSQYSCFLFETTEISVK